MERIGHNKRCCGGTGDEQGGEIGHAAGRGTPRRLVGQDSDNALLERICAGRKGQARYHAWAPGPRQQSLGDHGCVTDLVSSGTIT